MKKRKMIVNGTILAVAVVGQIALTILFYDPQRNSTVINIGWGVLMLSAVFGWLPIITFRRKGQVQGRGYIHTTVLVDSGVYAIVRHPQYLAGVLINLALPLISWNWMVAALGLVAAVINYLDTFEEEKGCIEKFGQDYLVYMKKVPRLNFLLGILRVVRRRCSGE